MRRHGEDPAKWADAVTDKSVIVCPRQEEDRYGDSQITGEAA